MDVERTMEFILEQQAKAEILFQEFLRRTDSRTNTS
jgi:hypothetical protein